MQPSNLVQPEAFTTEDHTELDQLYFATGDEGILTGVWECAPCKEEIDIHSGRERSDDWGKFLRSKPQAAQPPRHSRKLSPIIRP